MTSEGGAFPFPANLPSPSELATAWTRIFAKGVESLRAAQDRPGPHAVPLPYDPAAPARAMTEFMTTMLSNPFQMLGAQQKLAQEWTELWTMFAAKALGQEQAPLVVPEKGDRRFNDPAWSELPIFDYLKQAYLLTTRQTLDLVATSDLDADARTRVDFYARQFLNALSPANFAITNPEAIRKAVDTGGISLLSGAANMLADAATPGGLVTRRSADNFELGVNIAATAGSVVFQNELMQLIQYAPTTSEVHKRPLLYIPPLVNKYYILDLKPGSSLVKWLVDQGHSVFVISWVNPGPELGDRGLSDYITLGPVTALDVVEKITGEHSVDVFGFCMGGTLLATTAGYLAATDQDSRLGSLTVIGTLLDFSQTGEWATFYEPQQLEALERHVEATGVIGADQLQALFSIVRSNDLIWSSVVNHYLLDRTAPESDLLFWFGDGARIPKAFLLEYVKTLLLGNKLREANAVMINGIPINLGRIEARTSVISLKDDHVSAWQATYAGARLFGGPTRFLLGGSGHNAGLINPPAANKHGFWINDALPDSADEWFAGAERKDGSWWPEWQEWLVRGHEENLVAARSPGAPDLPPLEPAPGSYVRVK